VAWVVQIALGVICMRSSLGRSMRQHPKEIASAS
jgi:hypothetical protein